MNTSKLSAGQKGFAPILIVLLIALAIGGYLTYQKQIKSTPLPQPSPSSITTSVASSSDETTNWKTYTNDMFNFSFKYPGDWNINESKVEIILNKVGASVAILNIRPKDDKGSYVTDRFD